MKLRKPWHASRTLRFNAAVIAIAVVLAALEYIGESWKLPVDLVESNPMAAVLLFALLPAAGNCALRLITAAAVTDYGLRAEEEAERERRRWGR